MQRKMYLLVLDSLSPAQQIVQAAHVTAEFVYHFDDREDVSDWLTNHQTMVVLGVNEKELGDWEYRLDRRQIPFHTFYEPDVDKHTALAVVVDGNGAKMFRKLPMIQGDD